jgi:hypothetical protein
MLLQGRVFGSDRQRTASNEIKIKQIARIMVPWIVLLFLFAVGLRQCNGEDLITREMITDFQLDFRSGFFSVLPNDLCCSENRNRALERANGMMSGLRPIVRCFFRSFLPRFLWLCHCLRTFF